MYEDQPVAHYTYVPSDKFTSRSIVSLPGADNLFMMSTNSLKKDNEIHVIQFSEEEGKIKCQGVYTYAAVINKVFSHPTDEKLAYASVSSYSPNSESHKALVFKLDDANAGENDTNRKNKKSLKVDLEIPNNLEFNSIVSSGKDNKLILSDALVVTRYDLEKQDKMTLFQAPEGREITKSEIDPHHTDLVACVQNNHVSVIDTRDNQVKYEIKDAHNLNITDIDFNPNKPYCIITAGEDCQIKFWDIRKPTLSLKVLDDLSDCVESVRYNKHHDLLILSSNSSGSVNLHKVTSVSSAPILSTSYIEKGASQTSREEDLLVKCYEEQEDSVSSVAWSAGSAWIFASVSYRASVIVSMVPPAEKYKILL